MSTPNPGAAGKAAEQAAVAQAAGAEPEKQTQGAESCDKDLLAKAKHRVTKAKIQLLLHYRFWGCLVSRLQITFGSWVPTAATDGVRMCFNPEFVETLDDQELMFLIAHEVGHVMFMHPLRCEGRNPKKWNVAGDYVINYLLKESGLRMPQGGLYNAEYAGLNADQIYMIIPDDNEPDHEDLLAPGAIQTDGDKNDNPQPLTSSQKTALENDAKINLAQAAQQAEQAGSCPGSIRKLIDELLQGKTNWKEKLRQFATSTAKDDYSWRRPNRRFAHQNIFLPSMHSEAMGRIAIAVDTSGSVDDKMLQEFAGEVNKLIRDCNPEQVMILYCHSRVSNIQILERGEEWTPDVQETGGTAFSPVFKRVEEDAFDPACLVYLTDMYCSDFGPNPGYPVMWLNWGHEGEKANAPFGEVIAYERQERS